MFRHCPTTPHTLPREQRGSVAILIGLLLTVLIGMASLGIEITYLLYKHRQIQAAADSAAIGAGRALVTGRPADPALEARAIAGSLGFTNGVNSTVVAVNRPPLSGAYAGNSSAIEVVISQPQTLSLITVLRDGQFNVGAHAVAVVSGAGGGYCVLEAAISSTTGVSISNGAVVDLVQCGMAINSTSNAALSVTGAGVLNAKSVSTSGKTSVSNGGVINATDGVKTGQPSIADPYAGVAPPSFSGCNYTNTSLRHSAGTQYLSPGVYCNGLTMGNDAVVVMNPGVYIIDRGRFDVGGAVRLSGTGVTIFLTKSTGNSYATATIANGSTVTLSAPTSGAYAGLVFFGDRSATLSTTNTFGGGATFNMVGAIYFPSQTVNFNNGIANPSGCTQLIAGRINFTNAAQFRNNCINTGTSAIGGTSSASLVE